MVIEQQTEFEFQINQFSPNNLKPVIIGLQQEGFLSTEVDGRLHVELDRQEELERFITYTEQKVPLGLLSHVIILVGCFPEKESERAKKILATAFETKSEIMDRRRTGLKQTSGSNFSTHEEEDMALEINELREIARRIKGEEQVGRRSSVFDS